MGMKSYYVHCKNKFPTSEVSYSENRLEVYKDGQLHICLEKNGHGQILDVSKELGLDGEFDLSPIPRDARIYKITKDGKVALDELHEERKAWVAENVKDGVVKSIVELDMK